MISQSTVSINQSIIHNSQRTHWLMMNGGLMTNGGLMMNDGLRMAVVLRSIIQKEKIKMPIKLATLL